MTLIEKLNNDMKGALKEGAVFKLSTLRMVVSAVHNLEIEKRGRGAGELIDEEVMNVLRKEAKKRKEAAEIYGSVNRDDLKEKEARELEIIQSYLPAELGDLEIGDMINKVLASGEKEFGKIMKKVMSEVGGRAEGGRVGELIKKNLVI